MITSSSSALTSSRMVGLHDSQAPAGDFVADMSAAGIRSTKPILLSGPHVDTLPWRGTELLAEASACKPAWKPFKTLVNATAVHSRNNTEYERYSGIDLEPEHAPWQPDWLRQKTAASATTSKGPGDFYTAAKQGSLIPGKSGTLLVGECTAPAKHRGNDGEPISPYGGGTWHTQRVGPFTSVGGYDWHQLSWTDPAFVSRKFSDGNGAAGILAHFTGPTDETGTKSIGYPPIHQHHVHIVPSSTDVFLTPSDKWTHNRLMVIHGDWTFQGLGTGSIYTHEQAMGQDYGGYQKLIDQVPSINVELNDVRAANSPPMTFYYQISLRLADKETLIAARPLSVFKTHNVPQPLTFGGQSAAVSTYAAYYDRDSRMWYSSLWPMDSTLVSAYPHFHQTSHQESFLFSSTPQALGIGSTLSSPKDSIVTGNNTLVRASVLRKAEELDALVCSAKGRLQRIEADEKGSLHPLNTEAGACFDRAAYPTCYKKDWQKGEPFTVLTLNGPTSECGVDRPKGGERNRGYWGPDRTAPQHSIFFVSLVAKDPAEMEQSRYVTIFGSSRFSNTTVARRPKLVFGATDAKLAALERSQDRVVAQAIWGVSGEPSAFMKMAYAVACVVVPTLMVMGAIMLRRKLRRRQYESLASQQDLPWAAFVAQR